MTVKGIVPNMAAERLDAGGAFYRDILGWSWISGGS